MSLAVITKTIGDIDEFKNLYFDNKKTLVEILDTYNLPHKYADNLRKFALGLGFPKKSDIHKDVINSIDVVEFKKLYLNDLMTVKELATHFNVGRFTIEKLITKNKLNKSKDEWLKTVKRSIRQSYGVNNVSELEFVKKSKSKNTFIQNLDISEFKKKYKELGNTELAKHYNISTHYVSKLLHRFGVERNERVNSLELEIKNWLIHGLGIIDLKVNDRVVLSGKEIDFLSPTNNFGIEFNGMFWHNDLIVNETYHLVKTKKATEKGIDLYHIFEFEWITKKEIIKSIIRQKLKLTPRTIHINQCNVQWITKNEKEKFLTENHIFGDDDSETHIGLFFNTELVEVLTIGKSYQYQYTIFNSVRKLNVYVNGGIEKLWRFFVKYHDPSTVVVYEDIRFCPSNSQYEELGFILSNYIPPESYYFNNRNPLKIFSSKKFKKDPHHYTENFLYNSNKTEIENMRENNYLRFWDCGKKVLVWNKK
jgi:hypothetical protein